MEIVETETETTKHFQVSASLCLRSIFVLTMKRPFSNDFKFHNIGTYSDGSTTTRALENATPPNKRRKVSGGNRSKSSYVDGLYGSRNNVLASLIASNDYSEYKNVASLIPINSNVNNSKSSEKNDDCSVSDTTTDVDPNSVASFFMSNISYCEPNNVSINEKTISTPISELISDYTHALLSNTNMDTNKDTNTDNASIDTNRNTNRNTNGNSNINSNNNNNNNSKNLCKSASRSWNRNRNTSRNRSKSRNSNKNRNKNRGKSKNKEKEKEKEKENVKEQEKSKGKGRFKIARCKYPRNKNGSLNTISTIANSNNGNRKIKKLISKERNRKVKITPTKDDWIKTIDSMIDKLKNS